MISGQGEMQVTEQGAKREANLGRGRFDLLPYEALEAWARWSEDGAKKYGDRNWEKGLSVADCINRMVRHATKAANGYTDEDHLAATMWNAAAAITMMARRPDCNDHPWHDSEEAPEFLTKKLHIPDELLEEVFPGYKASVGGGGPKSTTATDDTNVVDVIFIDRNDFPELHLGTINKINEILYRKRYPTRAKFMPEGE